MNNNSIRPNTTMVPNYFLDQVAPLLDGSQVKVMLYMYRRIFGFERTRAHGVVCLPLSQIAEGRMSKDGERYDLGAQMSKGMASKTLKRLEELGLVLRLERTKDGTLWAIQEEINLINLPEIHSRKENKAKGDKEKVRRGHVSRNKKTIEERISAENSNPEVSPSETLKFHPEKPQSFTQRNPEVSPRETLKFHPEKPTLYIERKKERKKEKAPPSPLLKSPSTIIASQPPENAYFGMPDPKSKWNRQAAMIADNVKHFNNADVSLAERNIMVDVFLEACGKKELSLLHTLDGDAALSYGQRKTLDLAQRGYATSDAVENLMDVTHAILRNFGKLEIVKARTEASEKVFERGLDTALTLAEIQYHTAQDIDNLFIQYRRPKSHWSTSDGPGHSTGLIEFASQRIQANLQPAANLVVSGLDL